jgi:hypothetical protein
MTGKPDDLVDRLRDRAYSFKAKDPLLEQAADVIQRLRKQRLAIEFLAQMYSDDEAPLEFAAALRDMLEQMKR